MSKGALGLPDYQKRTVRAVFLAAMAVLAAVALSGTAQADGLKFKADLSGAQEVPEVITEASAKIKADFSRDLSEVKVKLKVDGTEGDVVAAHFHCNRAGLNGAIAFGLFSPGPCVEDARGSTKCTLTNDDLTDVANACEGIIGRPVKNSRMRRTSAGP